MDTVPEFQGWWARMIRERGHYLDVVNVYVEGYQRIYVEPDSVSVTSKGWAYYNLGIYMRNTYGDPFVKVVEKYAYDARTDNGRTVQADPT